MVKYTFLHIFVLMAGLCCFLKGLLKVPRQSPPCTGNYWGHDQRSRLNPTKDGAKTSTLDRSEHKGLDLNLLSKIRTIRMNL